MPEPSDRSSRRGATGDPTVPAGRPDPVVDPVDPVAALLRDAFDHEVRPRRFDEERLVAGTRSRLRRRRRARRLRVAAAALVAVAAVPLAAQAWPTATVTTTPVGRAPAAPSATATPSATPSASATATPVGPTPAATSSPAGTGATAEARVPALPRARAAVPAGLSPLGGFGPYREERTPLAGLGVACDLDSPAPRTVAAEEFQWIDEDLSDPAREQEVVTLRVTVWPSGAGPAAFAAAADGSGACRFTQRVEPLTLAVPGADQSWAARTDSGPGQRGTPFSQVSGVARVGDLLVGVSHEGPTSGRTDELAAVLTAAVADLRAAAPSPRG